MSFAIDIHLVRHLLASWSSDIPGARVVGPGCEWFGCMDDGELAILIADTARSEGVDLRDTDALIQVLRVMLLG